MTTEIILLLFVVITGFIALAFLMRYWISSALSAQKPDQLFSDLIKSVDNRSNAQTQEIREQTRILNERLDNAARVIAAVQKNIGEFSEIGRGMKDLQEYLQSPKLRGNIGEEVMGDILAQLFPKQLFALQHGFKSGYRVDAIIKTSAGILPIDSKFPLENFQKLLKAETKEAQHLARRDFARDVKGHIETIAKKYILPDEGTLDFAMMYVPSESVYYELVQEMDVMNHSKKYRVYPVSPTTLYAHLQTILVSFAGKQLESRAKELFKLLRGMNGDFEKIEGNLSILGKHLSNAYNQMGEVTRGFSIFGQKLKSSQMLEEAPTTPPKLVV